MIGTTPRIRSLVAALALVAAPLAASAAEPFKEISVDEVASLLGKPGVHLFDANTAEVFAKSRVPGAVFVTNQDPAKYLPTAKDAQLVYYCKNPK